MTDEIQVVTDIPALFLTMRLKNNRLRRLREGAGLRTVAALARETGIQPGAIGDLEALRKSPRDKRGNWRSVAVELSRYFRCLPEDIFPDELERIVAPEQSRELEANEVEALAKLGAESYTTERIPELPFARNEAKTLLMNEVRTRLSPRQQLVLRMRFWEEKTLEEIGAELGIKGETVRQIEARALQKLKSMRGDKRERLREMLDA